MQWFLFLVALTVAACVAFVWKSTVPPERATLISADYFQLRDDFKSKATAKGATLSSIVIAAAGPNGETLTVDIARFGSATPKRVVLHVSGTHGVEGYAGSAIQSRVIGKGLVAPPEDTAVIFVHGLNPWGMAFLRRFDESNVDLNRNFLLAESDYSGAADAYVKVHDFLNPSGPPARVDTFFPQVVYQVLRHGFTTLKQAIAGGQYKYPDGIYFGGAALAESLLGFRRFIEEQFVGVEELYVVEVHTGLGEWARDVLFWPLPMTDKKSQCFAAGLAGEVLTSDAPDAGVGFRTPGDLQNEVPKLLPNTKTFWLLQEFGAYGPVSTLRALRDENRYHQSGGHDLTHWSKRMLLERFSPGAEDWQRTVLERGEVLFNKTQSLLRGDVMKCDS